MRRQEAVKGASFTNLSPTDLLGAAISLTGALAATVWLREDRPAFWFYFYLNIWPLLTALAKSISICTATKWDDLLVAIAFEMLNTTVFLYYVSEPVYDDAGSIITLRHGNMEAYKMGTLMAFAGTNIIIALFDFLYSKVDDGTTRTKKGVLEFGTAFKSFLTGLQMILSLQILSPSHPLRGDTFSACLTTQLWAENLRAKEGIGGGDTPTSVGIAPQTPRSTRLILLLDLLGISYILYMFVCFCSGLQGTRVLVYIIPPCQWPENVDMSVAAKLTRPMPGIMHDPLPSRSDCTMKNSFGWDLVANASNLTHFGDYSADKNSTKKYGVGPYDPFGTAWGVSSYDFISREKFNESYDAWVAAGLYFNNQTDSGKNSYDYNMSLVIIIFLSLHLPCVLLAPCVILRKCGGGSEVAIHP